MKRVEGICPKRHELEAELLVVIPGFKSVVFSQAPIGASLKLQLNESELIPNEMRSQYHEIPSLSYPNLHPTALSARTFC